jgi:hypothetical protein
MALTLVDKVLSGNFKKLLTPPLTADGGGKRKRTESGSSSGSYRSAGSSYCHSGGDLLPGFTRAGGSRDSRFDKQDARHTGGSGSGSGRGSGDGYKNRF